MGKNNKSMGGGSVKYPGERERGSNRRVQSAPGGGGGGETLLRRKVGTVFVADSFGMYDHVAFLLINLSQYQSCRISCIVDKVCYQ